MALWLFCLVAGPSLFTAFFCTLLFSWHPSARLVGEQFLVELWSMGFASNEYRGFGPRLVWFQAMPVSVLAPLVISLFLPLLFLCLPDTRRISRVRLLHVVRGAAYGFAWLVPAVMLRALCYCSIIAVDIMVPMTSGRLLTALHRVRRLIIHTHEGLLDGSPLLLFVVMAWIMLWWHAALKHGWRITQYNRVWWALMIPAWLIVAIVALYSRFGLRIF